MTDGALDPLLVAPGLPKETRPKKKGFKRRVKGKARKVLWVARRMLGD
jgi:hypothetical protein